MVTVVIYFARSSGLKNDFYRQSDFIKSQVYSFPMLSILSHLNGPIYVQSYFDFCSLGISDQKHINCTLSFLLHSSFFFAIHLTTTLNSDFLLLHDFTYPERWNMPLNNKHHHQQESSFSCLRYEWKKWIVSAHRMMRALKLLIWK